jgi:hypothetical protein
MNHLRKILPIALLGALCAAPAFAQSAPPDRHGMHDWMAAHKGDMAAWHSRMCSEHYARRVGQIAYLGATLDLNDSQRPLFDSWKNSVLGSAKQGETACLAHAPDMGHPPTALDREARMHAMLEARLAAMDAQKPALEALYQSLSPEQKAALDHMGHHHRGGGMDGHDGHGWHHDGQQGPEQKG